MPPPQRPRRRRRGRGSRRASSPPPPPPPPITVVSVTAVGAFAADWVFSSAVSLSGDQAPELEIDGGGLGFIGPDSVEQTGAVTLRGDYSSGSGIEVGDGWRILTQPAGISPALAVPAGGNLV